MAFPSIVSSLLLSFGVVFFLLSTTTATAVAPVAGLPKMVAVVSLTEKNANATLQEVIAVVENLCLLIGGGVIGFECKFLLSEINNIIQWIAAAITPLDICQRLHFCNGTAPAVPLKLTKISN